MKGGDLFWIWKPYDTYITVDLLYGKLEDTFVFGQSVMNLFENALNILAVYYHFQNNPAGLVLGFLGLGMTLAKTILYSVMDAACDFCNTRHNEFATLLVLYVIPNGMWIIVPFTGLVTLGSRILDLLHRVPHDKVN